MEQKIAPDCLVYDGHLCTLMHNFKDKCCCFNKKGHRASQDEAVAAKFQRNQLLSVLLEPMYNSWAHTELRGWLAFSERLIIRRRINSLTIRSHRRAQQPAFFTRCGTALPSHLITLRQTRVKKLFIYDRESYNTPQCSSCQWMTFKYMKRSPDSLPGILPTTSTFRY